jgi:DNA polymerase-3 subunit gamma/tau
MFARPRLPELTRLLRRIADGEKIDAPDAALSLVARSARGSFRDAVSTLDQLAASTAGAVTVQAVLQLLGAVEEEALFRIGDLVVDGDTAGLLLFVEELADQGQDLNRLVQDLLEHLRHLLLVQHMGEVPDSLPVTEETRERIRSQANQLGEPVVLRLIDLLAVAVDDARQGGDPRLPLELALVKVTRPGADLSRESLAYRLEQLEVRGRDGGAHTSPAPAARQAPPPAEREIETETEPEPAARPRAEPEGELGLEQVRQLWQQVVLPAVGERSIPLGSILNDAKPVELAEDRLTVEFPASGSFNRQVAEEPKNAAIVNEVVAEVTGRPLAVAFTVGKGGVEEGGDEEPASEDEFVSLFKSTFDAREVDEPES